MNPAIKFGIIYLVILCALGIVSYILPFTPDIRCTTDYECAMYGRYGETY